jgi:flagellar basal-body rod protein FlgC
MILVASHSLSALDAFGKKMAVIANNVANIQSEGFKKGRAILTEAPVNGVSVEISQIETPGHLRLVEEDGKMVEKEMSNVDPAQEISLSLLTKRYYQANLKVLNTNDEMLGSLLDIIQ